jgi:hypothetical protein
MKVVCGAVVLLAVGMMICDVSVAQQDFNGYPCLEDCSGHQAGYDWAESHGIIDAYDCGGNSQSFIEGCQSYAEEYGSEAEDAWSADPDESDDVEMDESDGF